MTEPDGADGRWDATWESARKQLLESSLAATPAQRLAWLEELLELSSRAGAVVKQSTPRTTVLESIRALLTQAGVPFRELHHAPTRTSEDSAKARGEPLEIGGKALLMKVGDDYALFVISAARRIDSGAIRRHLGARKLRFASADELTERTGLLSGDVPPFGEPILPFPLYADESVFENERIAFNAGSLTDSIIMQVADWERVARPQRFSFTRATG